MLLSDETIDECRAALAQMRMASALFYRHAVTIGVHPFIEFTGLMNEYIQCCENAIKQGVDFRECSTHGSRSLPMPSHSIDYVNEKLECIFTGRSVMEHDDDGK